jgi:Probable cobalt transporter subunit (CbtA)
VEKRLILRGVLSGAAAGLIAFVFGRIFAEPLIQKAIDYEGGRDAAQAALDTAAGRPVGPAEAEVFTRTIQADVGLGLGLVLFGAAMGALVAVVYTICVGRTGGVRPRPLALLVAGAGFLGFYLVPFLKYPANPPAIGNHDTIQIRGTLYLVMVACSVGFLALAVWGGQRLKPRFGPWNATLLAGAGFVVAIGIVMVALPSLGDLAANRQMFSGASSETPPPLIDAAGRIVYPGFPADVLAQFRVDSIASQLILWSAIGLIFAPMAEKLLTRTPPFSPGLSVPAAIRLQNRQIAAGTDSPEEN